MLALYGKSSESAEAGPERWASAIHPEDREHVMNLIEETVLTANGTFEVEFHILRGAGSDTRIIRSMGIVSHDQSGTPMRITDINWDVTEERLRESQLAEALAQKRNSPIRHEPANRPRANFSPS